MPALLQFKRTKKAVTEPEVLKVTLNWGEPFYKEANETDGCYFVIGDEKGTAIENLPKFTPTPPPKKDESGTTTINFNNVYYYEKGGKKYLVDSKGNPLSVIGGGGATISTYTGTLTKGNWKKVSGKEYYTQDVVLLELQEKNPCTIDVLLHDMTNYSQILSNWKYVLKAETYDGGIKFYAVEEVSCDLPFQVQSVNEQTEVLTETTATILKQDDSETVWTKSETGDYYTQTITIQDISTINSSTIDLIVDLDNYETQLKEWGKIIKIDTKDNVITVYAENATTIDIPIQLYVYTMADK